MKASLALAVTLAVAGSACQDNWQSFFIHGNKGIGEYPECVVPSDEQTPYLLAGVLDVSTTWAYYAGLGMENALVPRADQGRLVAESNGIFVQGAYVSYEPDPRCAAAFPDYEATISAYIDPRGYAGIPTVVIPPYIGEVMYNALAGCGIASMQVTALIQVFGVTQAGTDVLTQEFAYPIYVCNGCLLYCPPGADASPATPGCQCDCSNTEDLADPPCHPGQDAALDCRQGPDCW